MKYDSKFLFLPLKRIAQHGRGSWQTMDEAGLEALQEAYAQGYRVDFVLQEIEAGVSSTNPTGKAHFLSMIRPVGDMVDDKQPLVVENVEPDLTERANATRFGLAPTAQKPLEDSTERLRERARAAGLRPREARRDEEEASATEMARLAQVAAKQTPVATVKPVAKPAATTKAASTVTTAVSSEAYERRKEKMRQYAKERREKAKAERDTRYAI